MVCTFRPLQVHEKKGAAESMLKCPSDKSSDQPFETCLNCEKLVRGKQHGVRLEATPSVRRATDSMPHVTN
jgi:hypothetical protein